MSVFLTTFLTSSQEVVIENDSLILWQESRPLRWEDFKGPKKQPKHLHLKHQAAACGMEFKENFFQETPITLPVIDVLVYFSKYRSWTITDDVKILEHEQIHFDIQELYTRKIRKRVQELKAKNVLDVHEYIKSVDSIYNDCQVHQDEYDEKTYLNYERQCEWGRRVLEELEALKAYEYNPVKNGVVNTAKE